MLITIVSIIILIIIIVVLKEIENSKKYNAEREYQKNNPSYARKRENTQINRGTKSQTSPPPISTPKPEVIAEVKVEVDKKDLPIDNYLEFDHSRSVDDLGLSEEDARDFVRDLISQVETDIISIKNAVNTINIEELDQLTHSIKGSATNLGSGGIADLLTDFNTYLKDGRDKDVLQRYFELLEKYYAKLRQKYN